MTQSQNSTRLSIFISYAHQDEELLKMLLEHLRFLDRLDLVNIWYNRNIRAGGNWSEDIRQNLEAAHIILLMLSAAFVNSKYCYEIEMKRALERYNAGEARVIPIVLRPAVWKKLPMSRLQALPTDGKPAVQWPSLDEAFENVAQGIYKEIKAIQAEQTPLQQGNYASPSHSPARPSSSGDDVIPQLEQIIQNFKSLRQQIASFVSLNKPKEVTVESCEIQYSKLYGDTMVFLALYFPESVSDDPRGFVELVHKDANARLRSGDIFSDVGSWIIRRSVSSVDKLVNLAVQVDACIATLELYKRIHFTVDRHSS